MAKKGALKPSGKTSAGTKAKTPAFTDANAAWLKPAKKQKHEVRRNHICSTHELCVLVSIEKAVHPRRMSLP